MTDRTWRTDEGSIAILGETQTGKTTAARELHAETDRVSIWVNHADSVNRVPGVKGEYVHGRDSLLEALRDGHTKINFQASNPKKAVVDLKELLWELSNAAGRSNTRIQLIVDEAHDIAPQSQKEYGNLPPRDAVRDLAKKGRKRGIKLILITQDPVALDKQTLRQMTYFILFPITGMQRPALDNYNIDLSPQGDLGPHDATVYRSRLGEDGNMRIEERTVTPSEDYAV